MSENSMKGDHMSQGKKLRVNVSLDKDTHDMLIRLANEGGYETVSRAIRSLVKKYGKYELDPFGSEATHLRESHNTIR